MHCPDPIFSSCSSQFRLAFDTSQSPAAKISAVVGRLVDGGPHLLISSLSDDFLHWLNAVLRFRRRFYDPCIDHCDLFKQIRPELVIRRVKVDRPLHYMAGGYRRLVSRIIVIGPNNWRIKCLEAVSESLLCTQNIPPRVSPYFGRVDDLINSVLTSHLSKNSIATYLGEHLVSFIEVFEQYGDLGFIGTPGQEFAKPPLHALHFCSFECDRTDFF